MLPKLAVPIRAAVAAPSGATVAAAAATLGGSLGEILSDDPRLPQISAILDERIRPALAGDGDGWRLLNWKTTSSQSATRGLRQLSNT
ncbi:MAG: hypothetical protein WKF84_23745 [Pyrinomonadaceae bacterium]